MVSSSYTTEYIQDHSEYLFDKETRKIYNKLISSTRKFHAKFTNIKLLENCVNTGTIPSSFKIHNQPRPDTSSSSQTRWSSASKSASIQWMKIVIKEEQTRLKTLFEQTTEFKNILQSLIPEHEFISIQRHLIKKNSSLQQQAESKSSKKLDWLMKKQNTNFNQDTQDKQKKKKQK